MGQVLTWEAVRSGKIPKRESFHIVASHLRAKLSTEQSVVSALLFGSVVRGDFNIRSDIDCIVLYKTEQERDAMMAMHQLDKLAHELHVPINFTPCDTVLAQTRLHHFGASFIRHLQASIDAGGLIKGDLVGMLGPTIPTDQEIESYIKMKMYNMQESLAQVSSFSQERFASFLKKALEASTHVARKMLIYEGTLEGDSKRQVQQRYWETMPLEMAASLDVLLTLDSYYSSELAKQIHEPNRQSYRAVLKRLGEHVPLLLHFLRLNILHLDATVR